MWNKGVFAMGAAALLALGVSGVAQAVPTGPPPYVVGMELDDAIGTLAVADYQGVVSTRIGGGDECTVLSQSPTTRPPDFENEFEGEFTILLGVRCGIEEDD
ncbi:hypothetical protein HQ346_23545 [Rhodococcus sp. BP-252]|uniref:hypothetical protein n=1 Tax=unclassified Rhodococcus (in: high G+C Gram-positive bacteria) TaxID=192944 RepID=UPI0014304C3F|nr:MULTISPECIES: hypothetical protein [unclassified Rhodococcus (in: high G+C Gram-positive bacteria)]MBY6414579.1 hypothetical protein [Rhodococcus sp. BP-320]MBY6419336.1 hypothetical protein [Rhodococcus sp. BP-321]MBY6424318.1 hypothetical protein [Rhodococcus sp. BP-324]MBY6429415.1 hypothetical protein [Rhodococcus sp. BP-323]MBY6431934.1 hypothetical protein [Rhodococcus sp. BP-322]